jgi:NAD(P)-dependent dehydrogenase (short-subunit alcohol dehydrogenase family)
MGKLEGKVALITGAGQGVGRGIALAMAAEGAAIAVLGRTKSKCDVVVGEIEARGGTAISVRCDVESRADVDTAVAEVIGSLGRIDILVNNAQTLVYRTVRRFTEEEMDSMWESGPKGCLRFMQACFEQLRANGGCVINMGSGSSIMPQPLMSGYAMAKEAIRVLSRTASLEWGKFGIRVNSICPLAETPGWEFFIGETPEAEQQVLSTIPLNRMGDCEADIGRAAAFLASAEAGYITGTTLMVDGGFNYLR